MTSIEYRRDGRAELSLGVLRVVLLCCVGAYIGVLRQTYTTIIVPQYGYLGYAWSSPSTILEVAMVVMAVVPGVFLPINLTRPSQYVLWFLYVVVTIPAILVPMYNGLLEEQELLLLSLIMLLCFLLLLAVTSLPVGRWPRWILPSSLYWTLVLAFVAMALLLVRSVFGTQLSIPTLSEVYQRRAEFKDTAKASGSGVVYLCLWLANVINPLLMARGLLSRRWAWGLVGLCCQVAIFSVSGFKSTLLTPVLLAGLTVLMKGDGRGFALRFCLALVGMVGLGLLLDGVLPTNPISGLLVRRLIITPGLLTGAYDQYFSQHPKALLGYSVFQGLAPNLYGQGPPLVIGEYLAPGQGLNANTNFWADAFANFGFGGMFVLTLLLGSILWVYDGLSAGKHLGFAVLVLAMPTFSLGNSALLTCLATHGLGLAVVVIGFLPSSIPATVPRLREAKAT